MITKQEIIKKIADADSIFADAQVPCAMLNVQGFSTPEEELDYVCGCIISHICCNDISDDKVFASIFRQLLSVIKAKGEKYSPVAPIIADYDDESFAQSMSEDGVMAIPVMFSRMSPIMLASHVARAECDDVIMWIHETVESLFFFLIMHNRDVSGIAREAVA